MADSQKAAREFVARALQQTGWTPTKLAREANLAPSTLNRFLNDPSVKHTLSSKTLAAIAAVSGLKNPFEAVEAEATYVMPKLPVDGRGGRELPVMGIAVGGSDEFFDLNGHVIDKVECPAILNDVPNAYAIYMRGTSMRPKYEDGQLLYINPHKPPRAGDYVVVEFTDHRAFVKRFVRRDNTRLVVSQFSPERELTFELSTILQVHKIVAADEIG